MLVTLSGMCHTRQVKARLKRPISDAGDAIANDHASQAMSNPQTPNSRCW